MTPNLLLIEEKLALINFSNMDEIDNSNEKWEYIRRKR